jgi:hypothetical protein
MSTAFLPVLTVTTLAPTMGVKPSRIETGLGTWAVTRKEAKDFSFTGPGLSEKTEFQE